MVAGSNPAGPTKIWIICAAFTMNELILYMTCMKTRFMSLIVAEDLGKRYGVVVAVDGLNLKLDEVL